MPVYQLSIIPIKGEDYEISLSCARQDFVILAAWHILSDAHHIVAGGPQEPDAEEGKILISEKIH